MALQSKVVRDDDRGTEKWGPEGLYAQRSGKERREAFLLSGNATPTYERGFPFIVSCIFLPFLPTIGNLGIHVVSNLYIPYQFLIDNALILKMTDKVIRDRDGNIYNGLPSRADNDVHFMFGARVVDEALRRDASKG